MNRVVLDTAPIDALREKIAQMGSGRAQVGIFADQARRKQEFVYLDDLQKTPQSNVDLGAVHEFGQPELKIPERSFLRGPLMHQLGPKIEADNDGWVATVLNDDAAIALGKLAVAGEETVQESFDDRGPGKNGEAWPALADATIRKKGFDAPLVESAQMRESVASRVVL